MLPRLQLQHITKRYPGVLANDQISLAVQPGEIHAVLGENGAGKSTLMKIIYGAVKPDAGELRFDGRPVAIANPRQARALVLQCSTLLAQDLVTGDQLRVARCVLLQRRLPGARQCRLCGVLALRAWDPFGQALQRRFGVQAQLDQARAVRRPGLDQGLARRFGSLVGLFAPRQGRVQFVARGLHRLLRSG